MDSKPDRPQTAVQFATTALTLALVGIYEVMSCSVSQRTLEIGIRGAPGAARTDVIGLVVWQGLRVAAAGIAVESFRASAVDPLVALRDE